MKFGRALIRLVFVCGIVVAVAPGRANAADPPSGPSAVRDSLASLQPLLDERAFERAEIRARALLADLMRRRGTDSLDVARVLDFLFTVESRSGAHATEAVAMAERSVRIREVALGPDDLAVVASLERLGQGLYMLGDYPRAVTVLERSLAIREKALGPEDAMVGRSLTHLGNVFLAVSRIVEARVCYERALAIDEKTAGPEHPTTANTVMNLGIVEDVGGNWTRARLLYERALAIREKVLGPDDPSIARGLGNMGQMFMDAGDYESALPVLERALKILETKLGPTHPGTGWCLDNLANALVATQDYERARPLYERVLEIEKESVAAGNQPAVAQMVGNYANLLKLTGDYDGALERYRWILGVFEKVFGPEDPTVASALKSLADVECETGDYVQAKASCERVLSLQQKSARADQTDMAATHKTLAFAQANLGEAQGAFNAALRTEEIGRAHLSLTLRTMPERQALRYAAVRESGLELAVGLVADSPAILDGPARAFDALIRSRALVLDEMAARHRRVAAVGDSGSSRRFEVFVAARQRYANLWVRGARDASPEEHSAMLDSAHKESEQAERALAEKSAEFRREQDRASVDLSRVAEVLQPGDALVAYTRAVRVEPLRAAGVGSRKALAFSRAPAYVAFVLRGGETRPATVRLGSLGEVDSLVSKWSAEVQRGSLSKAGGIARRLEEDYRRVGQALRERIWDPLLGHLGNPRRVFIVPEGALNLVSFASLPDRNDRYLAELEPVLHYLSAERDLVTPGTPGTLGSGLLVLGGPDFDVSDATPLASAADAPMPDGSLAYRGARSGCSEFRSLRFEPLPGTAQEVEDLVALWSKNKSKSGPTIAKLTGRSATKTALRDNLKNRRIVHLATHGFFLNGSCPSALDARGIGGLSVATSTGPARKSFDNPLLHSGLALSGANQRSTAKSSDEDGILTAEEITTLDLSSVEWAVLSACKTGVGEVRAGEGVLGLRRALAVAGARTTILSLWDVEDEAARDWMNTLYSSRLERRMNTADAVQEANRQRIRARRARGLSTHPFYWGAFVAAGDWR